ncbi:Spore germination protein B3 precursor [Pelotomaculum schinkii]|uniref:Spore germination protein B3 n=1 Tax=Pelotomaculum schinkii TaxID=78350 RepID=A0A4Y7REF7_9FIRM|nr:Ger(x)C family spore germination protein [Pelotomaculum schinkii]TEB07398.1 Spore germination protein B3 precursor [Pelotomaculum schinkii]
MTRKAVSLLLILLTLVCLSGCWSRREMSELAIVMGAGVDRTPDNRIRLTLQLARPGAFGGGAETGAGTAERQNITWVLSETGDTIFEAERNLALKISRRIYWAHDIILVLGEEAAKAGVRDYIDFFMRDPLPRETTWVLVTRGEAKKLLESHSELEKTSAQSIGFLARNKAGFSVMLKDFAMALASRGTNPALPGVELQKLGEPQGSGMEDKKQHEEVVITGTGVFKDEYLVGWLDTSETRGLLWLRGEINKGIITVPSPGQPDKLISINVARAKTRVEPEYDGENISFNVTMTFEGELLEQQSSEELTTPDKVEEIETAAAGDVFRKCSATLEKAQGEYGVDIFKFGEAFHRKYKKDWKELKYQWNDAFAKAQVNISVEAHLRRTGLLSKPASVKK